MVGTSWNRTRERPVGTQRKGHGDDPAERGAERPVPVSLSDCMRLSSRGDQRSLSVGLDEAPVRAGRDGPAEMDCHISGGWYED